MVVEFCIAAIYTVLLQNDSINLKMYTLKILINKKQRHLLLTAIAILAGGFLLISIYVFCFPVSFVDREFSEEVQEHTAPILDTTMRAISCLGYMPNSLIVVLATALIFFLFKYKKEALFLILTLVSGLVSSVFKIIVNRARPLPSLVRIIETTRQQSYPSGHMIFYIVFLGFLTLLMYQLRTISKSIRIGVSSISILLILVIPFSRIYLGAHWFTDVLGGFLLGALCLFTISYYYLKNAIVFR